MRQRTRARGRALQLLYAWESRGSQAQPIDLLDDFLTDRPHPAQARAYLLRLITNITEHLSEIDETLARALTNWRLDRLSTIDRNILRIATAEMLFDSDVPPRVSIQEAIHLAERFSAPESPRFVNGVLDAVMRSTADVEAT